MYIQAVIVTCRELAVRALEWHLASVYPKVCLDECLIVAFGTVVHDHCDDLRGSTRQPQSAKCTVVKLKSSGRRRGQSAVERVIVCEEELYALVSGPRPGILGQHVLGKVLCWAGQ